MLDQHLTPRPLLRRPLMGVALAYTAGTWCGLELCVTPVGWLWGATLGVLAAGVGLHVRAWRAASRPDAPPRSRWESAADGGAHLAVFMLAWFAAAVYVDPPAPRRLAALMERPRESVELTGLIADDPEREPADHPARARYRFAFETEAVRRLAQWQTAEGRVRVSLAVAATNPPPRYGERWLLTGVLSDRARRVSVGADGAPRATGVGVRQPLPLGAWVGRRYDFAADAGASACLSAGHGQRWRAGCYRWRRQCAALLTRGIEDFPEIGGLVQALLLGYRQELPAALKQRFIVSGTYHIFAISGQHIAIIALFIVVVVQAYRVCRLHWFLFAAPVLIGFTVATGMSASAVRGCIMGLLCLLGPWLGRRPDVPSALACAALLILAAAPAQLFDYGFILSFGAVAGLIALCPLLMTGVESWAAPDPFRLQAESRLVRLGRRGLRGLLFLLASSAAAWCVTAPLIAYWFHLVSPIAWLANLVAVPVSTLILLASCVSVTVGGWFPWLGETFNFANVALATLLDAILRQAVRVPYGYFYVTAPPLWTLAVWYAAVAAWARGYRRTALVGAATLMLAGGVAWLMTRATVRVELAHLRRSAVVYVDLPGRADVLINAGARFEGPSLVRYLRRRGVDRLKVILLTQTDEPHAGAVEALWDVMPVEAIWCVEDRSRSPTGRRLEAAARARAIPWRVVRPGETGVWPGMIAWRVTGATNDPSTPSDESPGLVLTHGAQAVRYAEAVLVPPGAVSEPGATLPALTLSAPVAQWGNGAGSKASGAMRTVTVRADPVPFGASAPVALSATSVSPLVVVPCEYAAPLRLERECVAIEPIRAINE